MGTDRQTHSQPSLYPIHHHSPQTNMKTLLLAVIPMVIFAMVDAQYGSGGCDWRECRNNRSLAQRCCDLSGTCCDYAKNPGNNNGGQGYNPGWNNGYNNGGYNPGFGNGNGNCYNGNCYNPGYGNNGGNYNGGGYNNNNKPGSCPPYNGRKKRSPRGRFPGNNGYNNGGQGYNPGYNNGFNNGGFNPGYNNGYNNGGYKPGYGSGNGYNPGN